MRTLLAIVILAVLGWTGWWWFVSSARDRALTGWLDWAFAVAKAEI